MEYSVSWTWWYRLAVVAREVEAGRSHDPFLHGLQSECTAHQDNFVSPYFKIKTKKEGWVTENGFIDQKSQHLGGEDRRILSLRLASVTVVLSLKIARYGSTHL